MRLPDLEAWAMFAAVVEHRSFTDAAKALSISKATVSKAVTRLEQHLETSLFNRTSRRLALTESGKRLAAHAARILEEGQAAEEAARQDTAELSGTIRLGAPMTFGLLRIAPLIAEFAKLHPAVDVDLHLSDARIDMVEMGLDATLRIADMPDSSLRARRLGDVKLHVIASPSYLAERGRPTHPSDLGAHDCLCYSNAPTPDVWRFSGPGQQNVVIQVRARITVNSGDAMLPALKAGIGIARLPDFIVSDGLASGELQEVLVDWRPPPLGLHLVTPPSRLRPARVEALLDYITRHHGC
ncbi:LysR family transcriptional regulator [Sphingomonadales bacterium 56]|uniref:LysR family transcriptional regulator n=1 Tax=unclassified Sphingobium TaxID=2611147 RepID=UPI00191B579A|nr:MULTISPECIES: LysR family transcriptional regulator [unclassified Sphingobium]MBY2927554.1 LysR family transcriptional regulator [Sphingomonadales bacterium 56]MBY2957654.1 LysR family transcriptional regulator [Sphingomonadales bacterium 58]CAD7335460.1 HTH-type transcriptional regulator DmlR [Sphingobium sp. S6]CAD7335525.1 HTH-type transcriptional regulator DmlR [Sphingobium sp. S8]